MISAINPACQIPFKRNLQVTQKNEKLQTNPALKYADSFLHHSVESIPAMLSMTVLWSYIDKASGKMPFKKAFFNNMKGFFLPVLVASSALLSYIDNRNAKKTDK